MVRNIFISYRRGESEGIAILLLERLQDNYDDIRVLMDVSDIYAGGNYKSVVYSSMKSCNVMILIIGPDWELVKDEMGRNRLDDPYDFVRVEVQTALERGVSIAPVLVNRDKMPQQDDLPYELRDLLRYDPSVVYSRRFDEFYNRLLVLLDGYLGKVDKRISDSNRNQKDLKVRSFLLGLIIILIVTLTLWIRLKEENEVVIPIILEEVGRTDIVPVDVTHTITPQASLEVIFTTQTPSFIPTETYTPRISSILIVNATSTFALLAPQITDPAGISMVLIPQGPFIMGTNDLEPWDLVSRPAAKIGLDMFYIDKFEVSNRQYADCVLDKACLPPSKERSKTRTSYYGNPIFADYPVIYVSWKDASTYCSWRGGRLPIESEWEKAARGEESFTYPWGGDTPDCQHANFTPDNPCVGDTDSIDSLSIGASPYGVMNMSGNVYEWVQDWFQTYPGGNPGATKDYGQTNRVVRGGAYFDGPNNIRTTSRFGLNPENGYSYVGFRCVIDIDALP